MKQKHNEWELEYFKTRTKDQIECRKTFSGKVDLDYRRGWNNYNEFGQVLVIVPNKKWRWKNAEGTSEIRVSMNGPCNLSVSELNEFKEVVDIAKEMLDNASSEKE